MANSDVMVANTFFAATVPNDDEKGVLIQVKRGDRYRASHPLVKQCPQFFDPEGSSMIVEAATAAPGEFRGA